LPWNYKRKIYIDWYQGLAYRLIDYFVTGSYNLGVQYANNYRFNKNKILEVPNWINLREFQNTMLMASREEFRIAYNIPDNARVMFYMQRLSERKGTHYLPEILSNVPSNVFLVVAGDGPYKETLENRFKDLKLMAQVRMLGRVPNEMMAKIFKSVDIFLLPSEEEGMAHALLEAMASGTPSVAFDVGATKDMYPSDYKGFVVEAKNIKNFIAKVNYLLQNKLDANLLGQSLKDAVIKYDKEKVLNEFKNKVVYN
jgi:glycosyltransferase involved in cell wall biosynthesis